MRVLVYCIVLLLVGVAAYDLIAPPKTDEIKAKASPEKDTAQSAPSIGKTEESKTVSEQQAPDIGKAEESEAVPKQQTPDVDKTEEPEVNPCADKDMITYEPPEMEGFWLKPDVPDISENNMIEIPSAGKTRHPISGMSFIKDGKVDPTANPDKYPYGLKVYSDNVIMTNPPVQYVYIYYFRTKEERSAFNPEQHRW